MNVPHNRIFSASVIDIIDSCASLSISHDRSRERVSGTVIQIFLEIAIKKT